MKKRWMPVIFCLLLSTVVLAQESKPRPERWATPVAEPALKNFYKVDDQLYRGGQPDAAGMQALKRLGIAWVLNLREFHDDKDEASGTGLVLVDVPMNAGLIKDEEILAALKTIQSARGPILVHCWHGSDRTGVVIAMYRILFQGWTKEAAIDELVNGGYGYHSIYGNIVKYIEAVDVVKMKKALG